MLGRFFDPAIVRAVLALAVPAVRLSAGGADGETRLRGSRFGGTPVLPDGEPWPRWGARALDFMGVVDFGELTEIVRAGLPGETGPAAVAGLPERGSARFFYAAEIPRPWGDDPGEADGWRVIALPAPAHAVVRAAGAPSAGTTVAPRVPSPPSNPPPPRPADAAGPREVALSGAAFLSLPSPLEPVLRGVGDPFGRFRHVYGEAYRAWTAHVWPGGRPRHQAGGWPVVIQRPLGAECARAAAGRPVDGPAGEDAGEAAREWRLLLQLDSDDRLGWFWGDTGRVFFSIRAGDAVRGALDRCWLTLQSR